MTVTLTHCSQRIRRWLKYRARKLRKSVRQKLDPTKDPWAVLLAKLSGVKVPPKARQGYQQYMREAYTSDIAPVVAERWAQKTSEGSNTQTQKDPKADFRAVVARDMFAELPEAQREGYQQRAKQEAAEARTAYEAAMKAGPSKTPEDRQR